MTTFDVLEQVLAERENTLVGVPESDANGWQGNVSHRDGESEIYKLDYTNLRQEAEYLVEINQKLNAQLADIDGQLRELKESDEQRRNNRGDRNLNISLDAKICAQSQNVASSAKDKHEGCNNFQSGFKEQEAIICRLRKENDKLQSSVRDKDAYLRELMEKSTELKAIRKDRDRLAMQKKDLEEKLEFLSMEFGGIVIQSSESRQRMGDQHAFSLDNEKLKRRLEREQLKSKQLEIQVDALKEEMRKQSLLLRVPVVCCTDSAVQCPDDVFPVPIIQSRQRT